jgi:glycosyltransferase involved in cell wall biosynthesis
MGDEKMKTIGIYIPTYNRPHELAQQLDSILSQIDDSIFVYVNDNCSTTYDFESFKTNYARTKNLFFSKNAVNIEGNANIALSYSVIGLYDYFWILSDNDILKSDAIANIRILLDSDPDILVFNKFDHLVERTEISNNGWIEECPGLISEAVYKSSVFIPFSWYAYLYHNSSFPHLAVYYATINSEVVKSKYSSNIIFEEKIVNVGAKGNYALSISGFPHLAFLFPKRKRYSFLQKWLKDIHPLYFSLKNNNMEYVKSVTKHILVKYCLLPYLFYFWSFEIKETFSAIKNKLRKTIKAIVHA